MYETYRGMYEVEISAIKQFEMKRMNVVQVTDSKM